MAELPANTTFEDEDRTIVSEQGPKFEDEDRTIVSEHEKNTAAVEKQDNLTDANEDTPILDFKGLFDQCEKYKDRIIQNISAKDIAELRKMNLPDLEWGFLVAVRYPYVIELFELLNRISIDVVRKIVALPLEYRCEIIAKFNDIVMNERTFAHKIEASDSSKNVEFLRGCVHNRLFSGYFILDVFDCKVGDCAYVPNITPKTSLMTINDVRMPKESSPQAITSMQRFVELFHKGSNDFFRGPDGEILLPTGIAVAGGYINGIMMSVEGSHTTQGQDIDFFTFGDSMRERVKAFNDFSEFVTEKAKKLGKWIRFAVKTAVVDIMIEGIDRVFQLISAKSSTVADVILSFDLSYISVAYANGRVYSSPLWPKSIRERTAYITTLVRLSPGRLVKAMVKGFRVDITRNVTPRILDAISILEHPESPEFLSARDKARMNWWVMCKNNKKEDLDDMCAFVRTVSFGVNEITDSVDEVKRIVVYDVNFNDGYATLDLDNITKEQFRIGNVNDNGIADMMMYTGKSVVIVARGKIINLHNGADGILVFNMQASEGQIESINLIIDAMKAKFGKNTFQNQLSTGMMHFALGDDAKGAKSPESIIFLRNGENFNIVEDEADYEASVIFTVRGRIIEKALNIDFIPKRIVLDSMIPKKILVINDNNGADFIYEEEEEIPVIDPLEASKNNKCT